MFKGIKQSLVASTAMNNVTKVMGIENPYENEFVNRKRPMSNRERKALKKKNSRRAGYMGASSTKRYASPKLRKVVSDRQKQLDG